MRLIFISLIGFLSIFTRLCSCTATNIILSGIEISVSENFQTKCQNEMNTYFKKSGKKEKKGMFKEVKNDVISTECLMFCGYHQMGMVDEHGNIEMTYLKSFIPLEKSDYFRKTVSKCVATKKTAKVCMKALKNTMCVFARLDPKINILTDLRLMRILMD